MVEKSKLELYKDIFVYITGEYARHTKEMRIINKKLRIRKEECVAPQPPCIFLSKCPSIDLEQAAILCFEAGYPVRFENTYNNYQIAVGYEEDISIIKQAIDYVVCNDYNGNTRILSIPLKKNRLTWTSISNKKDASGFIRVLPLVTTINQWYEISQRNTFAFLCVYGERRKKFQLSFLIELIYRICKAYLHEGDIQKVIDNAESFLEIVADLENNYELLKESFIANANTIQQKYATEMKVINKSTTDQCFGIGISDILIDYIRDIESKKENINQQHTFRYISTPNMTLKEKLIGLSTKNISWFNRLEFDNDIYHTRLILTLLVKKFRLGHGKLFTDRILVPRRQQARIRISHETFKNYESGLSKKSKIPLNDVINNLLTESCMKLNCVLIGTYPLHDSVEGIVNNYGSDKPMVGI